MDTLTRQILELSGPMPDAAAHAHYLETLSTTARKERLATLLSQSNRQEPERVEFWRPQGRLPATDRQTTLEIS
jgi:hypothetical protein